MRNPTVVPVAVCDRCWYHYHPDGSGPRCWPRLERCGLCGSMTLSGRHVTTLVNRPVAAS